MEFGQRALLVVSTGRFAAGVIARSHGPLSARVLDDSPISASLPPNSLPVLRKSSNYSAGAAPIGPLIVVKCH
jgi:hypothetical protein